MNSSMDPILPDQAPDAQRIRYAHGPEMVAQERHLHVPAPLAKAARADALCGKAATRRVANTRFAPDDHGLPLLPRSIEYSDQDPKAIWIVVGDDTAERTQALKVWMRQLAGPQGRELFIRRGQVKWEWQLDCIRALSAELCARYPMGQVVTAFDAVEKCQISPLTIALQLQAILDAGATVACSGDDRHIDFLLLVFHLQMLGVMVICVPHRGARLTRAADVPEMLPRSRAAGNGALRRFPRVCTAALTAYLAAPPTVGARLENRAGPRPGQQSSTTESEAQATAACYARAYRKKFAIQRLLRERDAL
ncbi:hypothetical protein SAMN05446635_9197 [Burkholderia sp. OK233]|nr:hypothetical protein SAMN05446635_9197 [Burkholderia sp. OK233]